MLSSTTILPWLRRKRYQYEVTFSLYMLTPTEKFIFNSFLFLFISMIIIATSLYLPSHISTMASRAFYYYAGEPFGGDDIGGHSAINAGTNGVGTDDMAIADLDPAHVVPLNS